MQQAFCGVCYGVANMWWTRIERWFEEWALKRYNDQDDKAYRAGFKFAMEHYWIDKWPSDYIEECAKPLQRGSQHGHSFYSGVCYAMQLVDQMADVAQALDEHLHSKVNK